MKRVNFSYQKICENLLKNLPQRTKDVIKRRFGLVGGTPETLESIGKDYGITRERVRQIEKDGFLKIRTSLKKYQKVFQYFNDILKEHGGLKKEATLLAIAGGERYQREVFFLLSLHQDLKRISEDENFYTFWAKDLKAPELAKKVISLVVKRLQSERRPLLLEELLKAQRAEVEKVLGRKINKKIFHSFVEISKKIQKNPEDKWGLKEWVEINPRGIKDKAYLVFKREGRPLHFTEVAKKIAELPFSPQKAHVATVHNELIKDPRFVLVGRGLYALREWGYEPGLVKDIILKILKRVKKPLSKEEILKEVLKQRLVKENTVLLNLQDRNIFLKDEKGRYKIREA